MDYVILHSKFDRLAKMAMDYVETDSGKQSDSSRKSAVP